MLRLCHTKTDRVIATQRPKPKVENGLKINAYKTETQVKCSIHNSISLRKFHKLATPILNHKTTTVNHRPQTVRRCKRSTAIDRD